MNKINYKLQMLESFTQELGKCSGEVLSYDGSPGICGHMRVLFWSNSDNNRYFLMSLAACDFLQTTFRWSNEQLEVFFDEALNKIAIKISCDQLLALTDSVVVYELLNYDFVKDKHEKITPFKMTKRFLASSQYPDFFSQFSGETSKPMRLHINNYYAFTRALEIDPEYYYVNETVLYSDVLIILSGINYFHLKKRKADVVIKIIKKNNMLYIFDQSEEVLTAQCRSIDFVGKSEYRSLSNSHEEEINWFFTKQNFLKTMPREIVEIQV